jgi:hypothetical protein
VSLSNSVCMVENFPRFPPFSAIPIIGYFSGIAESADAPVGTRGSRVRLARWMSLRNSCAGCGFRAAPDERAARPHRRWGRLRRGSRRRRSTALQLGFEGRFRAGVRGMSAALTASFSR